MAIITKRTVMSMYSDHGDIYSHQVRMVLAEKGVNVEIISIEDAPVPEEVLASNPYGIMPVLIDRELVLYKARIIMEYLDERFPHPPLLPVYPVARAETRKMLADRIAEMGEGRSLTFITKLIPIVGFCI